MLLEYPDGRTSRLPASDRRGSPRALCMLQPPLERAPWADEAIDHAGLGEPVDAPSYPREQAAVRTPCLSGQTDCLVQWLLECRLAHRKLALRLDSVDLAGRPPRVDPDLEIPLAEQQHLLDQWSQNHALTHFQQIGLTPTADQAEIRRAYLATCQRLHPDRYFGRRIGAFAGVLVDLFHRAHAAQAYLADPRRCANYLRQLAAAGHPIARDDIPLVVLQTPSGTSWTPARHPSR